MKKTLKSLGPLVSIIINCYNGEKYLKLAIRSVINQTYSNWEIIFWDNKSTDKSEKVLKNFKDKRIKYFKSKYFTRLYKARNLAIKKAKGKYISFLDVDDQWTRDKLEKQIGLFKRNKKISLIYSNLLILNNKNSSTKIFSKEILPSGKITQKLLNNYKLPIITAILKKDIFKKMIFNNDYEIIGDFDFFLRLSTKVVFEYIHEPLAYYRIHEKNTSRIKIDLFLQEYTNWINKNIKMNLFKKYNFKGVYSQIQLLKIKKYFLSGLKLKAFIEIFKRPFSFKKLKFLPLLILPKNIIQQIFTF